MLDELRIRNLGVIEDAAVTLDGGLTVLTGETGAGKTLLVTAVQLLVGGRGDTSLVRTGADEAVVEARWVPAPAGITAWHRGLDDDPTPDAGPDVASASEQLQNVRRTRDDSAGPDVASASEQLQRVRRTRDDSAGPDVASVSEQLQRVRRTRDESVVARTIRTSGRSRVRIDGDLATVGALADAVGPTVEVHAQDSHRRLLEPVMQRRLLDAWAGADHLEHVTAHHHAHAAHAAAVKRRDRVLANATERARELDRLAFEIDEIDTVGLSEDDHDLSEHIDELVHAEDLRAGLATASGALGPNGAGDGLGEAVTALRRLPTTTEATRDLQERLDEVVALADDLSHDLRHVAESIDADPGALDRAQSRLAKVRGLTRKYGPDLDDVASFRDEAVRRRDELAAEDQDASVLDEAVDTTVAAMAETAAIVTAGRRDAAGSLVDAVSAHLADLGLGHARFLVEVHEAATVGPTGADDVRWLLAPNPGQDPVDLASAASGGERSRVALALEVALANVTDAEVLVFDEVDAGIGGVTAMQVGAKLAALARSGRQVLCVTHLAQLAAWADRQYVVDKEVTDAGGGATTRTTVTRVAEDERVAELARMLGGDTTEAARAHAAEVLTEARGAR